MPTLRNNTYRVNNNTHPHKKFSKKNIICSTQIKITEHISQHQHRAFQQVQYAPTNLPDYKALKNTLQHLDQQVLLSYDPAHTKETHDQVLVL